VKLCMCQVQDWLYIRWDWDILVTLLNVITTHPFGYSVDMASAFVVVTIAQCAPV
jgi:hypothetical protein